MEAETGDQDKEGVRSGFTRWRKENLCRPLFSRPFL